jgi:hypothetical protein
MTRLVLAGVAATLISCGYDSAFVECAQKVVRVATSCEVASMTVLGKHVDLSSAASTIFVDGELFAIVMPPYSINVDAQDCADTTPHYISVSVGCIPCQ